MFVADLPYCELYACKRPQHDDPSGVVEIHLEPDEDVEVKVCLYHQSIIAMANGKYLAARTYRGEIELRPVPAIPVPPREAPTPEENNDE